MAHYFSAAALAAELERAGMEVGRVESKPSDWGPFVRSHRHDHFHVRQHMLMRQGTRTQMHWR